MADDETAAKERAEQTAKALAEAQESVGEGQPITVNHILPFLSERQQDTVMVGVERFRVQMMAQQNQAQAEEIQRLRTELNGQPKNRQQARAKAAAEKKAATKAEAARKRT